MILNASRLTIEPQKKYMKQKLIELKRERDKPTSIFGVFNIPFLAADRTAKQKIITEEELQSTEFN